MQRGPAYLVLFAGLFAVSTSGPFIAMAGVDKVVLAFLRLTAAAFVFLVWAAAARELRIDPRHRRAIVAGAVILAAHFVLWMKAFDLTNFASNLVLLVAQPVIAALFAVRMGERSMARTWPALVLATLGLLVVARGDLELGARALLGDAFYILAGLAITLYYLITRRARAETPLPAFMGATFAVAALAVLPLALFADAPLFDHPPQAWFWVATLVLVTTLAGHGLTNLAARHVSFFILNFVIVLEPLIGIGLGRLMFGTPIPATTIVGGLLLAIAVWTALRA